MILAQGWQRWSLSEAPCLVPDCTHTAEYMKFGGYCREHTRQLGGLVQVGEETPTALAASTRAAIEATVRLQIIGAVSAVLLEAIDGAKGLDETALITALGIRIQNAISRRGT